MGKRDRDPESKQKKKHKKHKKRHKKKHKKSSAADYCSSTVRRTGRCAAWVCVVR
jgi:hypothetical protein